MHINTPVSGPSKGQAIAAPSPLFLFSVCLSVRRLRACCAATVFLNSFPLVSLSSLLSTSSPSSPTIAVTIAPPSLSLSLKFVICLHHPFSPSPTSLTFTYRRLISSMFHKNASQHRCQHADIYASPVFLICVFSLVRNAVSLSHTPSHLGIYSNSPHRHRSTLQTGAHHEGLVVFLSDTDPSWTATSFKLAV